MTKEPRGFRYFPESLNLFLSNKEHMVFLWQLSPISSKGRKWQLLNSCPYNGLQQFEREIEKLAHTSKLRWKKSVC